MERYKQRRMSPKERDEAISTITILGLAIAGTVSLAVAGRRQHKGVGRTLADTQTSFEYIFDDELGLYNQEPKRADVKFDPVLHENIERAWQAMEEDRRAKNSPSFYVDRADGSNYFADTVIEVYEMPKYSQRMQLLHIVEGEELEQASTILNSYVKDAKRRGADLYIYTDGVLTVHIPGAHGGSYRGYGDNLSSIYPEMSEDEIEDRFYNLS